MHSDFTWAKIFKIYFSLKSSSKSFVEHFQTNGPIKKFWCTRNFSMSFWCTLTSHYLAKNIFLVHSKFWGKVGANGGQVGENKRTQLPFSKSIAKYYQFSMECTIDGGVHHSRGALHHFECTTKVECTKIVRHRWRTAPFSSAPRKWMTRSTVAPARSFD